MAVAKKTTSTKATAGKGLAKWDEQLAKYATKATADVANTSSGIQSFSIKSGVLALGDEAMPGNKMAVIILDAVMLNVYHESEFDADSRTPPTCYAFGRVDEEGELQQAPHKDVVAKGQAINDICETCELNQWGSAAKGRGKACKNKYRLMVIPAGNFNKRGEYEPIDDVEHFKTATPAFITVPVTSGPLWSNYVKGLAGSLRRPPFAMVTQVAVVPSAKNNIELNFEALEEVGPELIDTLIERHEAARLAIEQPMSLELEERDEKPARGAKGKAAPARGKPATKSAPAKTAVTARKKY